jgi:hypothetical protein
MTPEETAQAIARVRAEWRQIVQATLAASEGNAEAANQLAQFLPMMAEKPEWRALADVLRRILAGERDSLALLPGLDDTDVIIAGDVLRGLGVDVPIAGQDEEDDGGEMVTLDDFLGLVAVACQGDAPPGMREQLLAATRGMATQPGAPDGLRELGRVLHAILDGDRQPDLSALPPDLADKARGVLDDLAPGPA